MNEQTDQAVEKFYNFMKKFSTNYWKLEPSFISSSENRGFIFEKPYDQLTYAERMLLITAYEDSCEVVSTII